jgi:hypothetical protein
MGPSFAGRREEKHMAGRSSRGMLGVTGVAAVVALGAAGTVPAAWADTSDEPNANEQYMIEVLNRTRANPDAEAARFGIDLNEGLAPGTLTNEAREPLAVNLDLIRAARLHNQDLLAHFNQLPADHVGSNGLDPTGRATAAGASFLGGVAENNSWTSQSSTVATATSVSQLHLLLFKDFTATFEVTGRGHRKVMLNGVRDEVGVGVAGGVFGGKTASICTQDFVTTDRLHITGVAFADEVTANSFYTPGEGLWGVRVVAVRQSDNARVETLTWKSGGYNLVVTPGTWDVTADGGGLPAPVAFPGVVVTDRNVKVDFVAAHSVPVPPPPRFRVAAGTTKLGKTGAWTLYVTSAAISIGSFTFPDGTSPQVTVEVDGTTYFRPEDRAASKVKEKLDTATGLVKKLVVTDASKNTFTLDLAKGTFKLTLASAPGFDPTDGTIDIKVHVAGKVASVAANAIAVGTSGKKLKLLAIDGTVQ